MDRWDCDINNYANYTTRQVKGKHKFMVHEIEGKELGKMANVINSCK